MTRRFALVAVVLVLVCASTAGATTLLKMDFGDLAREADRIVVGTVTGVEGDWDPSLTFIHSNVTLSVERTLRGAASDQLVLRTPGGWIGGLGQKADGAATFELGERVLVFLTTWEDGTPKVLGYAQGKSSVVVTDDGGERLHGGRAHGLSIDGAAGEIAKGANHNIALRPAN